MEKQPFQIGDKVRAVVPGWAPDWVSDWHNVDLWVAGIRVNLEKDGFCIDVCEVWPPKHRGDITTGWTDEYLAPR